MTLGGRNTESRGLALVGMVVIAGALVACGDDGGGGRDSGMVGSDTGTDPVDTGVPPGDTGMPIDSGGGGRMCTAPGGECDVILQNCAAPLGCYYVRADAMSAPTTMCLDVAATGGDGASCEFVNECLPGFTCSDGVCRHYCCNGSTSDCPSGSGQLCVGLVGSDSIGTCTATASCDLVTNDGCEGTRGCYIAASDGTLGCFAAGSATEGMACTGTNGCVPGMGCLSMGSGMPASCTKWCRISMGMADCGGTRMCMEVRGIPLPSDVGTCPAP